MRVTVCMTDLEGWERYRHCWLDGELQAPTLVKLDAFCGSEGRVRVSPKRIRSAVATRPRAWSAGDAVHVWEVNGGVGGWWEATIHRAEIGGGSACVVRWRGEYARRDRYATVSAANIRLAKAAEEDEEDNYTAEEPRRHRQ
jgi:hypothetical protein